MFEADIQSRPLHTSILDINKVFEPFVCCVKGKWVHPYTITPAKLAPDLGILGPLWTVIIVPLHHGWGWYPPQTASHILIRHIQSVWAIGMLSQGHMIAPCPESCGRHPVGSCHVSGCGNDNPSCSLWGVGSPVHSRACSGGGRLHVPHCCGGSSLMSSWIMMIYGRRGGGVS